MTGTLQMRLDITRDDAWEDLDRDKVEERIGNQFLADWVLERNRLAGAVTHRIVGDTAGRAMYLRGKRESSTDHRTEAMDDLSYWDRKLGDDPDYNAFLDGWTDAASGLDEYAPLYAVEAER